MHLGQAEIHHLHPLFGIEHDIGAFDITMDNAFFVSRLQALGNLPGDIQRRRRGQRAGGLDPFPQLLTGNVFHHNKHFILGFFDGVDSSDIGVI